MIGIIIATHAGLGAELINAVKLIAGNQPAVEAVGLYHGDSIEGFEKKLHDTMMKLDDGDGVLGLVDFLGGTPANTMLRLMSQKAFPCISGVNMPMLLEILDSREDSSLEKLKENVYESGIQGILKLEDLCIKFKDMHGEEDF